MGAGTRNRGISCQRCDLPTAPLPAGTICLYYPGYEDLSALLYTIGSVGFASVDFQELLTFKGSWLLTNISLSFIGSVWYIIGSVVRARWGRTTPCGRGGLKHTLGP